MRRSVTRLLLFLALCLTAPFFAGAAHAAAPTWTPQSGFLNNAIIAGDINLDGVKVSAANSLLGAFGPGGESDCRAVSNVPFDGNFSYFLVIGSDTAQTISFKYYDSGLDAVIDITETYAFVADDYQGALTLNATSADTDEDTIPDYADNCPNDANTDQADADSDGLGDVCDPDDDNDGVIDTADQCPGYDDNDDADSDNIPDECDECPNDANNDVDSDTVCGDVDNCPANANTDQADGDSDGIGNVCDSCPADPDNDADSDTVCGNVDNCPAVANTDQADADIDGLGDVCDPDDDNDGVADTSDLCPGFDDAANADGDDLPDGCDTCPNDPYNDADSDTICGNVDNCPDDANTDQADGDSDDIGNVCDTCPNDADNDADQDGVCGDVDECPGYDDAADADNDTVPDGCDNCPANANTNQLNTDGDDFGDVCDDDDDNDGILDNAPDNCPLIPNPGQEDADGNQIGDACDNPIITMNGTDEVLVVGDTYVDAGATVMYGGVLINDKLVTVNNVVTTTAGEYTVTYNATSNDGRVAETVVRHVTVYDPVEISTAPADSSLASGGTADFAVEGGSGEDYTWYVNGVEAGTGATFTFTAPTTAGFAGEYVVAVKDDNDPENAGLVDTFTVKVPMKITPAAKGITGITPMDLTVTGASTNYDWEVLADANDTDAVADPTADYGVFASGTTTDGANTFNPSALDAITTFYVRVTVTGDAGLTAANGLNTVIGGPYSIYPTMAFVGKIVKAADDIGIGGATVTVTAPISAAGTEVTTSNLGNESDGEFTIQLPNTGAAYQFEATADGYVPKAFTSDNLTSDVAGENLVRMTASDGDLRIQGVVTQGGAAPTVEVKVVAYDADGVAAGSTVVAAGGDDYTIFLSADNGPYSVVASIPGYVNARATGINLPDLGVNLNVTTLLTSVVNTATVTSAVIAAPAAGSSLPTRTMGGLPVSPVVIPAGSIADTVTTVTVTYTQVPVTGGAVFVIEAMDGATKVTFDSPIIINMPYDSGAITPDDILNGDYVIYHAPDQDDLEAGTNLETVPVDDIISIDIGDGVEGIITFQVSHLSAFAIKKAAAAPATPALGDSSSDPRCFIATAAFGSPFEAHVTTLRRFRDAVLLQSSVGRSFVRAYYRLSPPMANFIAGHDTLRTVARTALLPAVGMSYMVLNLGLLWSLAALAGSLLLSCLLVGVARKKND